MQLKVYENFITYKLKEPILKLNLYQPEILI